MESGKTDTGARVQGSSVLRRETEAAGVHQ